MKKQSILYGVILFVFTLLIINDFFPKMSFFNILPKWAMILCLVFLIVVAGITEKYMDHPVHISGIFITLYLLSLIIVLTLLGGKSVVGITLKSPILWIVVLISIVEAKRSKEKRVAAKE
ncbi:MULTISPECIES: hypothetical protein [Sporosarcina]|uniref:DUF5668 domain-containing protein n=1 Tax=Sporosarcina contaminans TaxID=633403 RepID=A0ABW3TXF5_9BACL